MVPWGLETSTNHAAYIVYNIDRVQNMQDALVLYTDCLSTYRPTRKPITFSHVAAQADVMVSSRAKAAPERAPTTVLRSSTTLLMLPEVADAPASMCKCKLGGESTGTAGKGQSREAAAGVCQWGLGMLGEGKEV